MASPTLVAISQRSPSEPGRPPHSSSTAPDWVSMGHEPQRGLGLAAGRVGTERVGVSSGEGPTSDGVAHISRHQPKEPLGTRNTPSDLLASS